MYNIGLIGEIMASYSKQFLVDAFLHRYMSLSIETLEKLELMANELYDTVGRDKFRVYCSLDADAIRQYKATQ